MYCTDCGTRNPTDSNFCKQCGRKIDRTDAVKISEEQFNEPEARGARVKALLLSAFQKQESGDYGEAAQACRDVLELAPRSTDAHSLLSSIHEKLGDTDKAIAERERVLELNPGSIADREKLDLLRVGGLMAKAPKITSVHAQPAPIIIDSPVGAAIVAVAVTLIVGVLGAGIMYLNNERRTSGLPVGSGMVSGGLQQPAVGVQRPVNVAMQSGAGQPGPAVQAPPVGPTTSPPGAAAASTHAQGDPGAMRPVRQTPPAGINVGQPGRMENDPRVAPGRRPNDNTFILPERDPGSSAPDGSSAGTKPPTKGPGTIEIVVTPDNDPAEPPKQGAAPANAATPIGGSRALRSAALQFQLQGNYRRAVAEYIRALDGAGDDAAQIHQKIALCYQNLDDKESAINHYSNAVRMFKEQVTAGRNTEAANQGIKSSEAGILACK